MNMPSFNRARWGLIWVNPCSHPQSRHQKTKYKVIFEAESSCQSCYYPVSIAPENHEHPWIVLPEEDPIVQCL